MRKKNEGKAFIYVVFFILEQAKLEGDFKCTVYTTLEKL